MTPSQTSPLRRTLPPVLFALTITIALSVQYGSPFMAVNDLRSDPTVFYSVANAMLEHGAMMYRDMFDHKGPVTYLYYASGQLLGGPLGFYLMAVLWNTMTALLLWRICRLYARPLSALVATELTLIAMYSLLTLWSLPHVALPFIAYGSLVLLRRLQRAETIRLTDVAQVALCCASSSRLNPT